LLLLLLVGFTCSSSDPACSLQLLPLLLQLLLKLRCCCCRLLHCCHNTSWRIWQGTNKPAGCYDTYGLNTVI
jgi:hypothetical protein